ncbi:hypothetical protein ACM66B_002140 [Microbotryomycetes sp. NB124-2]
MTSHRPVTSLVLVSIAIKCCVLASLLLAGRALPAFDASSRLVVESPITVPLVRWDTVYFVEIAKNGYTSEQQTAFMPGLPYLMRYSAQFVRSFVTGVNVRDLEVWTGVFWSMVASTLAIACMYRLTLQVFRSHRMAMTTAVVYSVPPSWPTFHAVPYTEPFAALFTMLGMLLFVKHRSTLAAIVWASGTLFRAQGIVLGVGFFGWHYILRQPWGTGKLNIKLLVAGSVRVVALSLVSILPFVAFQFHIRFQFCHSPDSNRPWCDTRLGIPYNWVQSHYWNVGLFRYWTLQQVPNFLFAAPVLAMSIWTSVHFYTTYSNLVISSTLPFLSIRPRNLQPSKSSNALSHDTVQVLIPFIHLHTALTLLLLFTAHVQIILRVCVTNPCLFWFVAQNLVVLGDGSSTSDDGAAARRRRRRWWSEMWIKYCVVWGTVSIVLWACFLPPA